MYLLPADPVASCLVSLLAIEQSKSGIFTFQEFALSESLTPPVEDSLTLLQVPLKLFEGVQETVNSMLLFINSEYFTDQHRLHLSPKVCPFGF